MTTPNTKIVVEPYLMFGGRCEEALEFYKKAIDAKVEMLMRHSESPDSPPPGMLAEDFKDKVMHSSFRVGNSVVMASDGCSTADGGQYKGFTLAIAVPDEATAERYFNALAEGGEVTMPLTKTFWSPRFGMLTDRFGIGWMINLVP